MHSRHLPAFFLLFLLSLTAPAQKRTAGLAYIQDGHPRHVLDIYTPETADARSRPVIFWIHGGGWQAGDKSDVAVKPKALIERGFVFVSTNYRLFPQVDMDALMDDVSKSLAWVHKNIAKYAGDPNRIFVGGHSAGAQVAALLCTDDRYMKRESVPFTSLKGCIPVDGDTYDVPKVILTGEHRQAIYGGKMPTNGHRQKFGNDPDKHLNLSAVTHIAKDKGIPPFFILYFSGNPDTQAQARHLETSLNAASIPAHIYGKSDSNHMRLNDDLGLPNDPATQELYKFLDPLINAKPR